MVSAAAAIDPYGRSEVLVENLIDGGLPTSVTLGLTTASQEEQARVRGIQAIGQRGCHCSECYLAVADLLCVARQGDFHSALYLTREKHAEALRAMADAPTAPAHKRALQGYRFLWLNG